MRRREFLTLAGGAAAWPLVARAQQPKRIPRIGFFLTPPRNTNSDEFLAGLHDLGWVEGESVHVEYRDAGGDVGRLPALAAELVALNVDVLVTISTLGVNAAHRATTTIPIVAIAAGDLVAMGLVASLAHPGGNITGQTFFAPELMVKRLEFLKGLAPSMTLAGVLLIREYPSNAHVMSLMEDAARALKVVLRPIEVESFGELEGALSVPGPDPIGGVVIGDEPLFVINPSAVAAIVDKRALPSVAAPAIAAEGGLLGYGVDYPAMFRHAAVFVDKILKGAKPGDIPIEQATKFTTVVNLKTAKALGIEIPPTLLAAADEVIE
jgi:putative tryptophan/tyrosine transport system substrate-binding protein